MADEITFEQKLKNKLPDLFYTNEKTGELYVPCGCYCPTGWENIVEEVLTSVNSYIKGTTSSEKNPDNARFYWFWKKVWVPVNNFLFTAFDPEDIPLLVRFSFKKKVSKGWRVVTPEQQKADKLLLGNQLREKLRKFGDWLKAGRHEYRSVSIPPLKIDQIKEKFGGLRIYTTGGDKYAQGQIEFATWLADKTCMFTGQPGKRYNKGSWIVTASEEQIAKFESERK